MTSKCPCSRANILLRHCNLLGDISKSIANRRGGCEYRGIPEICVAIPQLPIVQGVPARIDQIAIRQPLSIRPPNTIQLQVQLHPLDQYVGRNLIDPAQRDDFGEGRLLVAILATRQVALADALGKGVRQRTDGIEGQTATLTQRPQVTTKRSVTAFRHAGLQKAGYPRPLSYPRFFGNGRSDRAPGATGVRVRQFQLLICCPPIWLEVDMRKVGSGTSSSLGASSGPRPGNPSIRTPRGSWM